MGIFPDLSFLDKLTSLGNKSSITINGVTYQGRNISIRDNVIKIDGAIIKTDSLQVSIIVNGDVDKLSVDAAETVTISGNVKGNVNTMSGDVEVKQNIVGSVETMSGDVSCSSIGGKVTTMSGNITHGK
jgi:hypothetical protein